MIANTSRRAQLIAFTFVWTLSAGCGGGSPGADLTLRPKGLALPGDGRTLRVPGDERFNIISFRAEKEATLDSVATADASATQDGTASATANVTAGGTASATIQLGHAFTNDTARQLDVSANVSFQYEADFKPNADAPVASLNLTLYARDNRGRLIFAAPLLTHDNDAGPMRAEGVHTQDFSVTLGPNEGFYAYLAGGVTINAKPGHGGEIGVRLRDAKIELSTRTAPSVSQASDRP